MKVPSWKNTNFIDSPFVEITSQSGIDVAMQYPLLGMQHGESRCFVRREVYEKLLEVQRMLPEGIFLRIWDAWRPFALQEELYHVYGAQILQSQGLTDASFEEKQKAISQFVSLPRPDRDYPPLHTTGGAVDVTLIDAEGKELDMGTPFDSFSEKSASDYYEMETTATEEIDEEGTGAEETKDGESSVEEIRNRRRILRNAMCSAGFTYLDSEWWHYDYGNREWARQLEVPAIYRGAFTADELDKEEVKN